MHELHSFIDVAEDQGVIGRGLGGEYLDLSARLGQSGTACRRRNEVVDCRRWWSCFETGLNDEEGTVKSVRRIVEAAETLYVTKTKDHRELDLLAAMLNEYADEGEGWDPPKSAASW